MPNYSFKNNDTGEEYTTSMSMAEREEFLSSNPHVIQLLSAPAISYNDAKKPDREFRNLLTRIKKNNPRSTINDF